MSSDCESSSWKRKKVGKREKLFGCPCGKNYLSYPALYTHIKFVHNGVAPGQIKKPESASRGRPRISKGNHDKKQLNNQIRTDPLEKFEEIASTLCTVKQGIQIKSIYQKEPVYSLLLKFMESSERQPVFVPEDNIFEVKMGDGVCIFFRQLKERLSKDYESFYDQVILIVTLLVSYIIDETEDQNVLSNGNIGLMPQFANYFVIYESNRHIQRLKLQNLWMSKKSNLINALSIVFKWLNFKKFTQTKTTINQKYGKQPSISQNMSDDAIQNNQMCNKRQEMHLEDDNEEENEMEE